MGTETSEIKESMIEGRNAVREAFRAGKTIDRLYVQDGLKDGPVMDLIRRAKKADALVMEKWTGENLSYYLQTTD